MSTRLTGRRRHSSGRRKGSFGLENNKLLNLDLNDSFVLAGCAKRNNNSTSFTCLLEINPETSLFVYTVQNEFVVLSASDFSLLHRQTIPNIQEIHCYKNILAVKTTENEIFLFKFGISEVSNEINCEEIVMFSCPEGTKYVTIGKFDVFCWQGKIEGNDCEECHVFDHSGKFGHDFEIGGDNWLNNSRNVRNCQNSQNSKNEKSSKKPVFQLSPSGKYLACASLESTSLTLHYSYKFQKKISYQHFETILQLKFRPQKPHSSSSNSNTSSPSSHSMRNAKSSSPSHASNLPTTNPDIILTLCSSNIIRIFRESTQNRYFALVLVLDLTSEINRPNTVFTIPHFLNPNSVMIKCKINKKNSKLITWRLENLDEKIESSGVQNLPTAHISSFRDIGNEIDDVEVLYQVRTVKSKQHGFKTSISKDSMILETTPVSPSKSLISQVSSCDHLIEDDPEDLHSSNINLTTHQLITQSESGGINLLNLICELSDTKTFKNADFYQANQQPSLQTSFPPTSSTPFARPTLPKTETPISLQLTHSLEGHSSRIIALNCNKYSGLVASLSLTELIVNNVGNNGFTVENKFDQVLKVSGFYGCLDVNFFSSEGCVVLRKSEAGNSELCVFESCKEDNTWYGIEVDEDCGEIVSCRTFFNAKNDENSENDKHDKVDQNDENDETSYSVTSSEAVNITLRTESGKLLEIELNPCKTLQKTEIFENKTTWEVTSGLICPYSHSKLISPSEIQIFDAESQILTSISTPNEILAYHCKDASIYLIDSNHEFHYYSAIDLDCFIFQSKLPLGTPEFNTPLNIQTSPFANAVYIMLGNIGYVLSTDYSNSISIEACLDDLPEFNVFSWNFNSLVLGLGKQLVCLNFRLDLSRTCLIGLDEVEQDSYDSLFECGGSENCDKMTKKDEHGGKAGSVGNHESHENADSDAESLDLDFSDDEEVKIPENDLGTSETPDSTSFECRQYIRQPENDASFLFAFLSRDASPKCLLKTELITTWDYLKTHGFGYWCTDNLDLKSTIDLLSKSLFQASKDPLDVAVFYIAMNKSGALAKLFKMTLNSRMADFFGNDFSQARWKAAATKNAYVLMGKRSFVTAAAFFLLAGNLDTALDIFVDKMGDVQLAIVVARLVSITNHMVGAETVRNLIKRKILGKGEGATPIGSRIGSQNVSLSGTPTETPNKTPLGSQISTPRVGTPTPQNPTSTPTKHKLSCFTKSICHWILEDYDSSVRVLIECDETPKSRSHLVHKFILFQTIIKHPIFVRYQQLQNFDYTKQHRRLALLVIDHFCNVRAYKYAEILLQNLPEQVSELQIKLNQVETVENVGVSAAEMLEQMRKPPSECSDGSLSLDFSDDDDESDEIEEIGDTGGNEKFGKISETDQKREFQPENNSSETEKLTNSAKSTDNFKTYLSQHIKQLQTITKICSITNPIKTPTDIPNFRRTIHEILSNHQNSDKQTSQTSTLKNLVQYAYTLLQHNQLYLPHSYELDDHQDLQISNFASSMLQISNSGISRTGMLKLGSYIEQSLVNQDNLNLFEKLVLHANPDKMVPSTSLARWNAGSDRFQEEVFRKLVANYFINITAGYLTEHLFSYTLELDVTLYNLNVLMKIFPDRKSFFNFFGGPMKLTKQTKSGSTTVDKFLIPKQLLSKVKNDLIQELPSNSNQELKFFSQSCEELCREDSPILMLLKLGILTLYLNMVSKFFAQFGITQPQVELPMIFERIRDLYDIRKSLFYKLDRSGIFVENSESGQKFHALVTEKQGENVTSERSGKTLGNEDVPELNWQKCVQNIENCPFSEDGLVSCYARNIWERLVQNEIVREFLIYFLYKQEARNPEAGEETKENVDSTEIEAEIEDIVENIKEDVSFDKVSTNYQSQTRQFYFLSIIF